MTSGCTQENTDRCSPAYFSKGNLLLITGLLEFSCVSNITTIFVSIVCFKIAYFSDHILD